MNWMAGSLDLWTLAQAAKADEPPFWVGMAPLFFIVVLAYFLLFLPQRQEQKKRQDLLGNLKKNDRVVTIGGIIGYVANLNGEGDHAEVTLKVDDNTRIRFTRASIVRVLDAPADDAPKTLN